MDYGKLEGLIEWWPKKLLDTPGFGKDTTFVATKLFSDDELMVFLWGQSAKNMLSQYGIEFGGKRSKLYRELRRF